MGFSLLLLLALESENRCVFNENIQKSLKQMILLILFFGVEKKVIKFYKWGKIGCLKPSKGVSIKTFSHFSQYLLIEINQPVNDVDMAQKLRIQ